MNPTKLTRATPTDKDTLARLFQLYLYDISEFADWPIDADGRYSLADRLIDPYWTEPDHHPYFIMSGHEIAGFCLVNRAANDASVWDMGQFFVLRKFRGQGVAHAAFQQAVDLHAGRWQVRVLPANRPALTFWIASTKQISGDAVQSQDVTHKGLTMTWLTFETPL